MISRGVILINREKAVSKIFFAMGTVHSVLAASDRGGALEEIRRNTLSLHDRLNIFDETSEISRLNKNAGKKFTKISHEAFSLIEHSQRFSEDTGGAFDITALPLIKLWKSGERPGEDERIRAKGLADYRKIILRNGSVMLAREGMEIDLGGIAKGFAADRAREILEGHGISDAVINFGGTVIILGEGRVGIQNPFAKTGEFMGTIRVKDRAVVTSGTYERGRHIIDPRTGRAPENGLVSVTLVGACAEELDCLSTGIFVLGAEEGIRLLAEKGIDGIFVFKSGNVYVTDGLKNNFRLEAAV